MSEIPPDSSAYQPPIQPEELSPNFIAKMTRQPSWDRLITRTSADNFVGVVDGLVVKQSKKQFETPEAAQQALE